MVHSYFARVSAADVDGILELFEEDAVGVYPSMENIGIQGGIIRGHEALRVFYTALVSGFSSVRAFARMVIVEGCHAASPLHLEVTQLGGADSEPIVYDNMNMWEFGDQGKIRALRVYSGGGPVFTGWCSVEDTVCPDNLFDAIIDSEAGIK